MKNYLTTGEFAKLCRVKKQTLFHYDDIEILQPEMVGDNGYRYYSYKQLEQYSMISMLKDLEMPLAEIKEYMDRRSPENLIELLKAEAVQADKKLEEIKWIKHYIDTKTAITRKATAMNYGEIFTEECHDEFFVATPYGGPENDRALLTAITDHMNYCHEKDIYSAYSIGGMVETAAVKNGEYVYSHFFTRLDEEGYEHNHVKKAGNYLACCDNEGYHNLPEIGRELLDLAGKQRLETGRYFYEDVLIDELAGKNDDDYVVKLSVYVTGL
ncbi:MAG: MerR family transcriptional regulator [Eubacteriaceae bacterium]|nr:MerR family transcriptional regulator [Eubacteriaceae bacterium]